MAKQRKVERCVDTLDIRTAFEAALKLYQEWESPEGPAVVRDVSRSGKQYTIVYRLIRVWGKEAW